MNEAKSIVDWLRPELRETAPYVAVVPPEALAERLGLPADRIVKLDANENQYGPSPRALDALGLTRSYHIYPDSEQSQLREALARYIGAEPRSNRRWRRQRRAHRAGAATLRAARRFDPQLPAHLRHV